MKKTMTLVLAAIMLFGAVKSMASDDSSMDYEMTMGKINAAQISNIEAMIQDMEQFKADADVLYSHDGVPRVGHITKLENEAILLAKSLDTNSSDEKIDATFGQVSALRLQACMIVRDLKTCRAL